MLRIGGQLLAQQLEHRAELGLPGDPAQAGERLAGRPLDRGEHAVIIASGERRAQLLGRVLEVDLLGARP